MNGAPTVSPFAWALILSLALLWGGSYFLTGFVLLELPPLTVAALRIGIAAVLLHLLRPVLGFDLPWTAAVWTPFLVMGLLNNAIPFSLIAWSQTEIASGLASILNATTPMLTALVAHALTRNEKLTPVKVLGIAAGFIGVVVLIGGDALVQALSGSVLGQMACLGAALSYAFAAVFGRRFAAMGVKPITIAAGQLTCGGLLLLPVALWVEQPWTLAAVSAETWGAMFCIAALSTALAYIIYFRILALAGAVNSLLVTFLMPPVAIVLGAVFLGERLAGSDFAGMALILAGLACIDGRLFHLSRLLSRENVRR